MKEVLVGAAVGIWALSCTFLLFAAAGFGLLCLIGATGGVPGVTPLDAALSGLGAVVAAACAGGLFFYGIAKASGDLFSR